MGLEKYTTTVLKKMTDMVDANFEDIDFLGENWYWDYTWTTKQQDEFADWLENYLYNNKDARKALMRFALKDKKSIKRFVDEFIMNFGWKIDDEKQ